MQYVQNKKPLIKDYRECDQALFEQEKLAVLESA